MKLKKILFSFITIFSLLFADTVSAANSAPNTIQISGSKTHLIQGINYGVGLNLFYKETIDGKNVYCTQINKNAVTSGTVSFSLNKELDSRYAYVIANGYPNKSITGDKNKDYFITALAIWYLSEPNNSIFSMFNFNKGTFNGSSNAVVKEVAKLLNGAKNYSYTNPTLKVNTTDNKFTLTEDKKYYVSSSIGVTTTGTVGNYTVKLENAPSGTIVTDESGNTKNTFTSNEKFLVKVPASNLQGLTNEFKVSVSAEGSINKAYLYKASNSNYQNVSALYPVSQNVSDEIALKLNLTTEVQISKVDVTTSKELPGAKLTVKDSTGKVVDSWTSTNEVHVIKGLKPGKYTLTEEIAPEGYVLSKETKTFEVKADGTVTKVTMENKQTVVEISKVDVTTKKELPGAKLTVKDSNGKVVDSWTSTNEVHVIKGLKPGKYTLTEEIAPEGYVLSKETKTFEVKADGTVTKVTMENKQTVVEISKVDVTTGKELPGAKLTVKDSNGKVVDSWTSTNEVHVIKGLAAGKYTLTEEIAPEGYVLSTETKTFEVKADGTVTKVRMENAPEDKKPIYISKQDITTGQELPGAHLELKDAEGNLIEAWVSENTPHMVEELKPGKYYLTEVLAPEGYELSTETVEFTVKEDKTVDGDIIMYNKPETVVEVPSTSSFKTITSSLIGIIIIGLGYMIIYKNYKKNEEY